MKLRLRFHETRETLELEFSDTCTLHDLRRRIHSTAPCSVHISLNRKDELVAPSPEDTLQSLGVVSGDLIYYSLDSSTFSASIQGDSMGIGVTEVDVVQDQAKADLNLGVEDPAERSKMQNSGPEPMDVELTANESKRLSEPFFLKKILLEKSGDTSELTIMVSSVHAVMLESGFVLLDSGSDKFSFSKELLSVSLRYTLPELIKSKDTNTIESCTVKFRNLGRAVVVYETVGGSSVLVHMNLDKRWFLPVTKLVMDTLKSDKEGYSSTYRKVFMFWRLVKDGLVTPLLIGLCDKAGLEPPPCLMGLPPELKLKILELLPGVSIAKMACLCTEMRCLASENDLWKQKCLGEGKNVVVREAGDSVNWKEKFASFWSLKQFLIAALRNQHARRNISTGRSTMRFPRSNSPFTWFNGGRLNESSFYLGQPAHRIGGRTWDSSHYPRCN